MSVFHLSALSKALQSIFFVSLHLNLKVDVAAIEITCEGAQAPFDLVLNIVVLTVVLLMVGARVPMLLRHVKYQMEIKYKGSRAFWERLETVWLCKYPIPLTFDHSSPNPSHYHACGITCCLPSDM